MIGLDPASGLQWRLDFTKDGKITARGPGALYSALDSGTGWSEGDMLCSKFKKWNYKDLKLCASIFRNPRGSPEMKNEYLQITDFGIIPFSPDY